MEITRRTPPPRSLQLGALRKRMLQMFDEPFGLPNLRESIGWMPDVDVSENASDIVVRAELPGIDPKDVEIKFEDNILTLAGEKKEERREDEKEHYLYECSYGSFQRSFALPAPVNEDAAHAEFRDGVLTVTLPKNGHARGKRIEITAA